MKKRVISVLGSSPQQQCLVFGGSVTAGAYSPSVDVVMGLVSGMDSETGRTVPWCGEGARTGVKWPGTFPTTWPLLLGCRWEENTISSSVIFPKNNLFRPGRFMPDTCGAAHSISGVNQPVFSVCLVRWEQRSAPPKVSEYHQRPRSGKGPQYTPFVLSATKTSKLVWGQANCVHWYMFTSSRSLVNVQSARSQ